MNASSFRIIYVTHARLPTERAHGLATIKLCEAFAKMGVTVEIVAPRFGRRASQNVFRFYGVQPVFRVAYLANAAPARWRGSRLGFLLFITSFSLVALGYLFWRYRRQWRRCIFFSHDHAPLFFLSFFSRRIFYDIHHFPGENFLYRRVLRRALGFSVQTRWKIQALAERFGVDPKRVVYWPNGTDVEQFDVALSRSEARHTLGLSGDSQLVAYTGSLLSWKGVETLLAAVQYLPPGARVYIVGGHGREHEALRQSVALQAAARLVFIRFQPHETMPLWLKAADVLVLPNTGRQKVSRYYTSPMKLFEYMASGTPIVASRIPAIEEIVDDSMAVLVEPDNPEALAEGIMYCLKNARAAAILAERARLESRRYTWRERAERLIGHMTNLLP